ncbi:MAG: DUF92 domain-containing protein [Candidatus Marsarchaeota archaeon]|nr:DUF92 domain-containing protein [Candidatus Marsarchaeota archaeon]
MGLLTLDVRGISMALLIALAMLAFGYATSPASLNHFAKSSLGIFYVITMVYFLFLSAIVTRAGKMYKRIINQYQRPRGFKNVLANGSGPLIFIIIAAIVQVSYAGSGMYLTSTGYGSYTFALIVGFVASVAAVTSDKFSSEIGILDGKPTSLVTFKKVKKGTSGGVTWVGLLSGLLGAFLISLPFALEQVMYYGTLSVAPLAIIVLTMSVITLSGFIGTIVDSFLGHYEEKGIGNKYTSNFFCSLAGGGVAVLLVLVLGLF